ncbi:LVIVD repeat-containing protein [Actinoplanes sp. GCM10030250]|uniref:LVIVD repeat-containing protein n=1 Tax=Actinoplanes sp. GCM10030250 TaxID=3273376 RepID=UPI00361AD7E6
MNRTAPRGRLKRFVYLGAAVLMTSVVVAPASAAQAEAAPIPGVDEIVSSSNIKQIANDPKPDVFAAQTSYNSDLAFQGRYAFSGNYNGFTVYDIRNPRNPEQAAVVLCPGSQNDVSVYGNLLFLGTDSPRSDDSCESTAAPAPVENRWEGIKVFDISNPRSPKYVSSVKTDCGSHTQTLVPGKGWDKSVYVYVSSYDIYRNPPECVAPHDKISIVRVPLRNPAAAAVVSEPVLFPDGGYPGGTGGQSATAGCHDITAYPQKNIAAGACMGDGVLFDISKPAAPKVITTVRDVENFAFWHSATFNNDATKVVFTDELGGGGRATCNPTIGPKLGADAIYDIKGKGKKLKLEFRSYFKIPRENAATENCVAHNGSLIPVKGRDIMVQAWYQGGISVWDFTDSRKPKEIGYWERGPVSATELILGGSWSAYWYNGHIYSNDIQKGLDVLKVSDRRIGNAERQRTWQFNAQTQDNFRRW